MEERESRIEGTRRVCSAAESWSYNLKLETRNQKLFLISASAPASGHLGQCVLKPGTRRYEGTDNAASKSGRGRPDARDTKPAPWPEDKDTEMPAAELNPSESLP
jgi:hypothetical protein